MNTYYFPQFIALTANDLKGKTLAQLLRINRELQYNLHEIDTQFNERFCESAEYTRAYHEARKPLEESSWLMALALEPFYVASTLEKQARVIRERTVAA